MDDHYFPGLLLIAGNGRESGKTTLACRLIKRIVSTAPVVAIKISPHKHNESNGISIIEESSRTSEKDSARMLAAGALRSFYITAGDDELKDVIPLLKELSDNYYILCESGGLRKVVQPGLFVIVNESSREHIKDSLELLTGYDHVWMKFNGTVFIPDEKNIYTENNQWQIRK
jgi:hypothetical protein